MLNSKSIINRLCDIQCNRITKELYKNNIKIHSPIKLLGCSCSDFYKHISILYRGRMSDKNYGILWECHHIMPISSFDLTIKEDREKAFHYSNIVPITITKHLVFHKKYRKMIKLYAFKSNKEAR